MPLFCRHNRFEHNCPICSREKEAERRASRPARAAAPRRPGAAAPAAPPRLVTRKLARAADDGYRNDLIPGVKASADAERLASCLVLATMRLEFPGPYPALAEEPEIEEATWLAFLLTLAGAERPQLQATLLDARPPWGGPSSGTGLGADAERTIAAYYTWATRYGSQAAGITGEAAWPATRRFARAYERLALPGFSRAQRFDFLAVLGAAGTYELEADALKVGATDATTVAAKRALVAGETMFLERRARALAEGVGVPLAALDRGLALWDSTEAVEPPDGPLLGQVRSALGLS